MQIRLQVNPSAAGGQHEAAYDAGRDVDGIDEATAGLENTPVETTPPTPDPERPNQRQFIEESESLDEIEQGGTVIISRDRTARNQSAYTAMQELTNVAQELIRCRQYPPYYNAEQKAAVLVGLYNVLQNAEAHLRDAVTGPGRLLAGESITLRDEDYHTNAQGRRVRYDLLGRETEQPVTVSMLRTLHAALERQQRILANPSLRRVTIRAGIIRVERVSIPAARALPVVPAAVTAAPVGVTTRRLAHDVETLEANLSNFYVYLRAAERGGPRREEWFNRADRERRSAWAALGRIINNHSDGSQPITMSDGARVLLTQLQARVDALDTTLSEARLATQQSTVPVQVTAPVVSGEPTPPPTPNADEVWNNIQMGVHYLDRASEKRPTDPERSRFLELAESNLRLAREALQRMQASNESAERFGALQGQVATLTREISELRAPIF